ncbi:MAG: AAA family ATPase [Cyclobacteriaceae bacterium]|nr:AAA family ATPase [Cyclobacteriaceae bacterium]
MEKLRLLFRHNIERVSLSFIRYIYWQIHWSSRLIILTGARGVGKTTLLLQYIKNNLPLNEETLYVSLDNLYFSKNKLMDMAESFIQRGGRYLILDEVQKYPGWSLEVKNLYDNYPELKMIISGSAAIEIFKSEGDLSRRAVYYHMTGLSFREYINLKASKTFEVHSLDEVLKDHFEISFEISNQIKPLRYFYEYLEGGYYPFFNEDPETYHQKVSQVVNTVLEVDIPQVFQMDFQSVEKIKKLLSEIVSMVPFKPNISSLSRKLDISRDTLVRYLKWLEKADILNLLFSQTHGVSALNKPEKIYLNNPNLSFALNDKVNTGNIRECFFYNQVEVGHKIRYADKGDFMVNDELIFEIGGKKKGMKQLEGLDNAYVVKDDMEVSTSHALPLWLFGFLY